MSIEDIKVGCFQIILLFLLSINYIIVAMSHTLTIYHNYTPKFYCEASNGLNKTYGCFNKTQTFTNNTLQEIINSNNNNNKNTRVCGINDYIFETDNGEKSIVTDWGLICERSFFKEYSIVAYCVGVSIGAWIAGILIDKIGRLPVLAICLYSQGTMTVATYIVQSYPVFLVLRSLQGFFAQGLQNSTYILALELFPTKFRTLVSSVMSIAWTIGLLLLTALGYFIRDWRILQLAISVPTATTVLYIWVIPDSPKWLLARSKTTEADISLEKIIKYNNCWVSSKSKRELVPDSENPTPIKSEQAKKSQIFNEIDQKCNISDADEAANLLTPVTSKNHNSRVSLRAVSDNLKKRLSDNSETFIKVTETNCTSNDEVSDKPEEKIEILTNQDKEELKNETIEMEQPEIIESNVKKTKKKFYSFKNGYLIKLIAIVTCQWLSISTMNSFMIYLLPNFTKNRHINSTINIFIELIIYIFIYFILSRHGRRLPIIIFQVLNFIFCILIAVLQFLPIKVLVNDVLKIILSLLGRVSSISALGIIYLYTIELFPTVIRGTCFGLFVILSTIATISGPYIILLIKNLSGILIVNGTFNLISAILCFWLPETINNCLPDNLSDIKNYSDKICEQKERNNKIDRELLRDKLFSEDWVDAGNGIIVNFTDKN